MGFLDAIRRRKVISKTVDWTARHPIPEFTRIVEAKRYSTLDAKCVAQGPIVSLLIPNYIWLFKTNNNNFFAVSQSGFTGQIGITPFPDHAMAVQMYESLHWQEVSYDQVFPDIKVTDA